MDPDQKLRQLALDIVSGKVFTSWHLKVDDPEESVRMLRLIFLPLVLMDQKELDHLRDLPVGLFYEYYDKAGPRSVNGYPCFFSVRHLSEDDTRKLADYVKKAEEAAKEFVEKPDLPF